MAAEAYFPWWRGAEPLQEIEKVRKTVRENREEESARNIQIKGEGAEAPGSGDGGA